MKLTYICKCIVNKVVQGKIRAQIVKLAGYLIRTQLWSADADHKKVTLIIYRVDSEVNCLNLIN